MLRIDTHQHIIPPAYRARMAGVGLDASGGRSLPSWSAPEALAFMDEFGIERAVVSVSSPGVAIGSAGEDRALARQVNEDAAQLVREHPDRFGFFATLPLPDVDGSLDEVAYAFDVLGADGVILLANARGVYLGDPLLDPVFDELNRRGAVALIHPNDLPGDRSDLKIPAWMADFLLDTVRAALNLVATGTVSRCPDISFVLSHGGGFIPYVAGRVASGGYSFSPPQSAKDVIAGLQTFYLDVALTSARFALPSLLAFTTPDRLLFGSDWPFAQSRTVAHFTKELDAVDALDLADRMRANTLRLFPRFAADA